MSTKEIVPVERETRLAHPLEFSSEQIRLLGETVAKGCDQNELGFFLNVCKLKRLDPFTGQVHCVKRWDSTMGREKMSIQIGIDGFRVIAVRSGELAGISEPEFDTEDEQHPNWARVTVFRYGRGDEKIPYAAKVRWTEYIQTKKDGTPNFTWGSKPYIMLGKCAEAAALRKAFPDELSGMYSDEEMGQADNETTIQGQVADRKPPVQQPSRSSEKKPEQKVAAPDNGLERISGMIEGLKQGKDGAIWVTVDKKLVVVDAKHVDDSMVVGGVLTVKTQKRTSGKVGDFYSVVAVLENPIQEEAPVVDAEVQNLDPEPQEENAELKGLFDSGAVKKGSDVQAPKTIGTRRAQRLYTIARQNEKETGLTEPKIKELLGKLPRPLDHLSNLEVPMHDSFEKFATGEDDTWKGMLED